jgi:hypothetical protein
MTNKEKDTSIEFILSQGFVTPPTLWQRMTNMHRALGWKFIFWDASYSLIFAGVTLLGTVLLLRHAPIAYYQYSVALGFSPVLFLLIMLFAEISERACGLYALKQTCRYMPRQITALRCIYYSAAGMMFAVLVTAFATESATQFFRVLPLCLGGLFLCGAIGLSVMRWLDGKWAIAVFAVAWMFVNLVLPFSLGERWELFLSGLPLVVTIIFATVGAALFMYQTNQMLKEEKRYVIA